MTKASYRQCTSCKSKSLLYYRQRGGILVLCTACSHKMIVVRHRGRAQTRQVEEEEIETEPQARSLTAEPVPLPTPEDPDEP